MCVRLLQFVGAQSYVVHHRPALCTTEHGAQVHGRSEHVTSRHHVMPQTDVSCTKKFEMPDMGGA